MIAAESVSYATLALIVAGVALVVVLFMRFRR
jgi:hypothetical protein